MKNGLDMVTPLSGAEIVMRDVGGRYAQGLTLSLAEQDMVMTATAALTAANYGPTPATMKLKPVPLPENVKGALAQYAV